MLQPASSVFINSCLLALCPVVNTVLERGYSSISHYLHDGCTLKTVLGWTSSCTLALLRGLQVLVQPSSQKRECWRGAGLAADTEGTPHTQHEDGQVWELEVIVGGSGPGCVLWLRLSSPTISVGSSPAPGSWERG